MNYKIACPHCGGHIEFDAVHLGRTTPCPHCQQNLVLNAPLPPAQAPEPQPEPAAETATPSAWNVFARVFFNSEQKQLEETHVASQREPRIAATMAQVRNGTWQVQVQNLVLAAEERALWRQAAAAVDPSQIGETERTTAYGVTTKIFKSITTRLTQPPSKIASRAKPTAIAIPGEFIITNFRLVFTSRQKTFITRFENLVDVVSTLEGIKYSDRGQPVVYAVKYDQPNGDIITQLVNYGLELVEPRC